MGFFWERLVKLNEVEIDGEDQQQNQPADYTEDQSNENNPQNYEDQQDTPQEEPADYSQQYDNQDQGSEDQYQDNGDGEEETTDYTDMGGEGEPQDDGNPDNAPPPEDDVPVDQLKQQEEELYSSLSPEQLDIKHKELKNQFLEMFDIVNNIIERIGDTSTSEENIPVVEYVSNQLAELQKMLSDYMNSMYRTKSYIENSINYNRFLAVLNGINKILEEMNKKDE